MSRLEEIKSKWKERDINVLSHMDWLINRVEELEKERDEWKDTGQSYYVTNQELRERNKRYKQALEVASSEMHHALYSKKSDDVKRFYVENAKRKVDEALKGESDD